MRTFIRFACCGLLGVTFLACKKAEPEPEPVAPVEVAPAIKGSIRVIVTADAVLYPREQANIVPKVTAPVRRFLVSRGDHVKQGQLLAELENRDLVAAAQESRGQFAQAESNYRSTAGAAVPEQVTKAQADVTAARESMDASKKLLDNREQLFKEGALARKLVDEAQVAYAQAKAQYDTALQHMQALQSVGKDEQIRSAAGQVEAAKGRYDPALLKTWGPRVGEAIKKIPGVVDVLDGIENTISGPATLFRVDQMMAARAGFTPQEIELDVSAIMQGEPAPTPVVLNDRMYTIRVRFPESNRASVDAIKNTLLVSGTGRTGTLGTLATVEEVPGQTEVRRENLQRNVTVTARLPVAGMIPLALGLGAGSQMLQPLAIAVIGGILASMVLSLVITPAVHYYLAEK